VKGCLSSNCDGVFFCSVPLYSLCLSTIQIPRETGKHGERQRKGGGERGTQLDRQAERKTESDRDRKTKERQRTHSRERTRQTNSRTERTRKRGRRGPKEKASGSHQKLSSREVIAPPRSHVQCTFSISIAQSHAHRHRFVAKVWWVTLFFRHAQGRYV